MTTTEDSSASLGPRYAPKDPTLPDPWQGLIDGGTGVVYYWNPETNITQYEKPPPLAPPLQSASNGTMNQNPGQPTLQPAQQMFQQPAQQMQHQQTQPMQYQQAHQYPQVPQVPQISYPPYMQGPMYQYQQQQLRPQLSFQHVQNYAHQQGQPIKDPQLVHSQGQQPHDPNRQPQYPRGHQSEQNGFPSREDPGNQEMKRTGFSSPFAPQSGLVSHSQAGQDTSYRREIAQMGNGVVTTQATIPPPMGLKIGFDPSSRTEVAKMLPQQPKIAPLPIPRDQQAMRVGGNNQEFVAPGHSVGLNMVPGNTLPNMHNQAAIQNSTPLRPSPKMFDSSDYSQISAAEAYCKHHEVTVMGDNVPAPFMTFEATGFPPELLREIHLAGFSSPTPIQAQTWPLVLQSRDIVAIAKTGSGKTLGYLIPAFIHLRQCRNNPQAGPTVLVLAPTRELATQIQEEAIKFGRSSRISCTCLYGGAPKGPQLKEIERGTDIVVATPGRLNDILEMERINLRQISLLVLDEADRMLDMGFEPQIRKIVNQIPLHRQTIMFTATWPNEVKKIAGDLLVNPVQVNIGRIDQLVANKSITQYVEMVSPMNKQRRLEQIIRTQERGSKIIIFCSTKRLCDQLARGIGRVFGASAIHGDKSQVERDNVLNQFRSGKTPVLVATDVAARGLDIKDIRVVVNYDFPTGIEDYVHRIGRTGRAGATGIAYTFFSDQDWKHAPDLVKVLEGANQQVPPEIREMAGRGGSSFPRGRGGMMSRMDSDRGGGMTSRTDSGRGGGMMSRMDSGRGGGMTNRADSGRGGGRWDSGGGRGNEYGARNDSYGGRGGRGRGFVGPGGNVGRGRHGWVPQDRFNYLDGRGRFYDGDRRPNRGYNRDYERSRSRSRSRSWSRSRSRSRSWSRSRSRSRSRSYERPGRPSGRNFSSQKPEGRDRASGFDVPPVSGRTPGFDVRPQPDIIPTGEDNGSSAPRAEVDAQPAGPEPGAAQE